MIFYVPKLFCLLFVVSVLCDHVQGQTKVSSKLDFDDTEDKSSNSSVPVMPGIVQGRTDDRNTEQKGGDGSSTTSTSGGGGGGKSGPKIHGVRVTVDTGDTHKSKESKESVEITDVGKHKKRVGIHTDITFEITADGDDDANATSSAQRSDKEDASVPIYKGRGGSSTHKPRKPYDPKTHWNPNFSSERRGGYDSSGRGGYGNSGGGGGGAGGGFSYPGHYPQYPVHNVPAYTGSGDSRGGSIYRRGDGWTNYVPASSGVWTTERSYNEPYRPNAVTGHRTPSWKPCYCLSSGGDNRRRRDNSQGGTSVLYPTSSVIEVVDGKLERPFSRK